ncbi:hypothetical protein ACQP1K_24965 [Sphaerimonospora sp. CA-214678]|uniref:hypothetical protein n=1 Tax=Sphaerimonospora sp. CA-214678 TaxID=3240029 RepID=UPI003D8B81D8
MNAATAVRLRSAGPVAGAGEVAERLRVELERLGIAAEVRTGDGVALLSVWADLVVWCEQGQEGWRYRWWTGRLAETGLYLYTWCSAGAVKTAAHRVAERYAELRHLLSPGAVAAGTCDENGGFCHG